MKKNEIKQTYNGLTMELCRLKDIMNVRLFAQDKFGMEKLKFSQVFTFTGF
jgi:hypothetical protein